MSETDANRTSCSARVGKQDGIGRDDAANYDQTFAVTRPVKAPTTDNYEAWDKGYAPIELISRAEILKKPEPKYSREASTNGDTGSVVLELVFASPGRVTDIKVLAGLPHGLTERAVAVERQIKFKPALPHGQQVSRLSRVVYDFDMK